MTMPVTGNTAPPSGTSAIEPTTPIVMASSSQKTTSAGALTAESHQSSQAQTLQKAVEDLTVIQETTFE